MSPDALRCAGNGLTCRLSKNLSGRLARRAADGAGQQPIPLHATAQHAATSFQILCRRQGRKGRSKRG
jgi:hypothetical protein